MKVLYVSGDDYSANDFENHVTENKLTFEEASKLETFLDEYGEETNIIVEEMEFGDICPKFLDFIKNEVIDYDDSEHSNFYTEEDELFKHEERNEIKK